MKTEVDKIIGCHTPVIKLPSVWFQDKPRAIGRLKVKNAVGREKEKVVSSSVFQAIPQCFVNLVSVFQWKDLLTIPKQPQWVQLVQNFLSQPWITKKPKKQFLELHWYNNGIIYVYKMVGSQNKVCFVDNNTFHQSHGTNRQVLS